MAQFDVNGAAMRYYREERELSIGEAAELSGITAEKIRIFESGTDRPTWGEIKKISNVYRVPTLALADPDPKSPTKPTADYRTVDGRETIPSPSIAAALDEARDIQLAAAEIIEDAPHLFERTTLPPFSVDTDPIDLARQYRQKFEITVGTHDQAANESHFFSIVRAQIEQLGIIVIVRKVGELEDDCRGFCLIANGGPPIIVINTSENVTGARTFSLLHEFAHILLGKPGLSGLNARNRVERFCNEFAANFLMPPEVITHVVGPPGEKREFTITDIRRFAKQIKCSQQALALRLEELKYTPARFYERWMSEMATAQMPGTGFAQMSYPERMVRRLGIGFSSLVLNALNSDFISEVDAYRATNVKPEHYAEMAAEMEKLRSRVTESSAR